MEAKEILIKEGYNSEKYDDLEPEEERLLWEYVKKMYGHDWVFITDYPVSARPFYHMRNPEDNTLTCSYDLLYKGLEVTTGSTANIGTTFSSLKSWKNKLAKGPKTLGFSGTLPSFL